jgi:hypothetical protein
MKREATVDRPFGILVTRETSGWDGKILQMPLPAFPAPPRRGAQLSGYKAAPFSLRMFHTFSGVIGMSMWRTPR